jgi:mono/diheme cytochrome c family protein
VEGNYRFVSTTTGVASDADLARTIRNGLVPAGMPAFSELADEQVASLVAVLDDFWENRPPSSEAIVVPPPLATVDVAAGKELYATMCALCHGESGRGDGLAPGATIKDGAGRIIPPTNLASGRLKAGRSPEQIYLRIKVGVPGLMPPMGATLAPEQIWSIVQFLETSILPPLVAVR